MGNFINLTPHPLTLRRPDGTDLVLPPDPAGPVRVTDPPAKDGDPIDGIPVVRRPQDGSGELVGLPGHQPGTVYIVSGRVLSHPAVRGRADVLAPATGPHDGAVRDGGRVVAVTRLVGTPTPTTDTTNTEEVAAARSAADASLSAASLSAAERAACAARDAAARSAAAAEAAALDAAEAAVAAWAAAEAAERAAD